MLPLELRLPRRSALNINPRASVSAGRWAALAVTAYAYTELKAPNSQLWYAGIAVVALCAIAAVYYRSKITVDELRNVRSLGLCILQLMLGIAVMYVETIKGTLGVASTYLCSSAIARFLLLLRNPVR